MHASITLCNSHFILHQYSIYLDHKNLIHLSHIQCSRAHDNHLYHYLHLCFVFMLLQDKAFCQIQEESKAYMTGTSPRCPLFLHMLSFYGIIKRACKYISPILIVFNNQIYQYKIYSLNCVLVYFILFCYI